MRVIARGTIVPRALIYAGCNGFGTAIDFIEWVGRENWTGTARWNDGKGIAVRAGWIKESRLPAQPERQIEYLQPV